MPEGPEHHLAAFYINSVCKNRVFNPKITKSAVANSPKKHPPISWCNIPFKLVACARGKELKLTLEETVAHQDGRRRLTRRTTVQSETGPRRLDLFFQFGMSGYFRFTDVSQEPAHSHLRFYTKDDQKSEVLNFVDTRRFGKWRVGGDWDPNRGPDPMFEYELFRSNIFENLNKSDFNKPICEVLLNQRYFNGIGNYLRAEILYRAGIPPFQSAKEVLNNLASCEHRRGEEAHVDILQLCSTVGKEIIEISNGQSYDPNNLAQSEIFESWLQCYGKSSMKFLVDHNGRTIWFSGSPGPLAPKANRLERKRKQKT